MDGRSSCSEERDEKEREKVSERERERLGGR